MAPPSRKIHEVSSTPLADFFWIAGLDPQELLDTYKRLSAVSVGANGLHLQGVEDTINEDEDTAQDALSILESSRSTSRHSKRSSFQRLSILSDEARMSIRSLDVDGGKPSSSRSSRSNRSSATVRPVPSPVPRQSILLSDADFEKALRKFTLERESFFLDLNFSAGAVTQSSEPKSRPKTQKIVPEQLEEAPSRGFGSIRRHISVRQMNSMRRQPSLARQVSARTTRRASNYNSVIPVPQAPIAPPNVHPLKRKFDPVLLDRYPRKGILDDSNQLFAFPDYVPMFAFPNDINVVSSDTRPRSTWHGFAMTAADNSKIHAICVIVWIPMSQQAADELEKRCEEWRRANMTDAERELAASLGERLAAERAKLSRLLASLSQVPSGSDIREQIDDEIGAVEEKINVMADLLRPLRHGAASKIDGLTDGDTGLWIPRAYGVLGRDGKMTSLWKEWLRATVVPMSNGAILRVPPSSPKVGIWQPLEGYVLNLCTEAPSPISSKTQVELAIRELRLFARKEAINELPGSRNTDLYPLFRALTIPNIMILFEYVLMESRIILLSSHTAMLHLVSKALVELIWPFKWTGVLIPVLPARLSLALEAPCPYICGIERRYEGVNFPDDDYVLVDLDADEIQSTASPTPLPRQQRRKLMSLLQLAAPHHNRCGVPVGPPLQAVETFPFDAFSSENTSIFSPKSLPSSLARLVSLPSTSFGAPAAGDSLRRGLIFNAFQQANFTRARSADRPSTSRTNDTGSPQHSPISMSFPPLPMTPVSRNDSGFALQASLREKRSGYFDSFSKQSDSMRRHITRKPSLPFLGHASTNSVSTMAPHPSTAPSSYAPSTYAQSTIAASTIMPGTMMHPVRNTETISWVEGHCFEWRQNDGRATCCICEEKTEDGHYRCSGCGSLIHGPCASHISVVCPAAFFPDQIRAAFVRFFASLLYTYKKFMHPANAVQKGNRLYYSFNMTDFIRSLPHDHAEYMTFLQQTQAFNEFISEYECTPPTQNPTTPAETTFTLFNSIITAKRNRSGLRSGVQSLSRNPFSSRQKSQSAAHADFLSDTTEHLWRTASGSPVSERANFGDAAQGRDYRTIVTRIPGKLEDGLMREPRMVQGVPKITERMRRGQLQRKGISNTSPAAGVGLGISTGGLRQKMNGLAMNGLSGKENFPHAR